MGILNNLKNDASDASYRIAADKMSKGIKKAIVKALKDKNIDENRVKEISSVLETEVGDALVSLILGYGLTSIPNLKNDKRAVKLSKKFRENGMFVGGNYVMDILFQYFLVPANNILENIPEDKLPRMRVKLPTSEIEDTKKIKKVIKNE